MHDAHIYRIHAVQGWELPHAKTQSLFSLVEQRYIFIDRRKDDAM
jgi:hypothetical protein